MRKILLFSTFLLTGLFISQALPNVFGTGIYTSIKTISDTLLYICLAFIMINVGREFELNKNQWRLYIKDYFIAMGTAAFPWLLVTFYYVFVLLPPEYFTNADSWRESLLLSRFSAPTSAGILFAMLAAIGLGASWVYRKIQVLAIFDDLDTIILMIPLQIMMIGLKLEMFAIIMVVVLLLIFGWKKLSYYKCNQQWWAILLYGVGIFLLTWAIDRLLGVHIEILLPAFVLGMVIKTVHQHSPANEKATAFISFFFMLLVGMSMPCFLGEASSVFTNSEANTSILGNQPMMPWPTIAMHVIIVSILSNVGKMLPIFFYRDRLLEERLALSIGMFTRGEVGAGIIFIAVGYNIGGPALVISVLTLALNLILTGGFVVLVKQLALQAHYKQQQQ